MATAAARGPGFIESVKKRRDVEVWTVTRENREELPRHVLAWLASRLTSSRGRG